jgi:hypothetical protein
MDWVREGIKIKNMSTGQTGILRKVCKDSDVLWEIEFSDGIRQLSYLDQIIDHYEPILLNKPPQNIESHIRDSQIPPSA